MSKPALRRGEPVWVLAVILGGWVAMRAVLWDPLPPPQALAAPSTQLPRPPRATVASLPKMMTERAAPMANRSWSLQTVPSPLERTVPVAPLPLAPHAVAVPSAEPLAPFPADLPPERPMSGDSQTPMRPAVAAAHQLMWMAAVANLPSPQELIGQYDAGRASPQALPFALVASTAQPLSTPAPTGGEWLGGLSPAARKVLLRRWSADGWLLLRKGGVPNPGSTIATYGAAQAGAVLRYHLAPASGFAPTAYVRGYAALNGSGERQLATGLSVRPMPGIPVAAMVELRASRFANGTLHWRPAATLVSEFPPLELPLGLRAETYVQGGYVGGKAATGFIDGQFKLDRALGHLSKGQLAGELRAGAGVWGGGQAGASRIDVGPSITLGLSSGGAGARLAADWRFRVGGNAMPASGPALTVSAGF